MHPIIEPNTNSATYKSHSIDKLLEVWKQFMKEIKNPPKNKSGFKNAYQYTDLPFLLEWVKPALEKHDIMLQETPISAVSNGRYFFGFETSIRFKEEYFGARFLVPEEFIDRKNGMSSMQGLGGALTQLRRFLISSLCGITSDDDLDGVQPQNKPEVDKRTPYPPRIGSTPPLSVVKAINDHPITPHTLNILEIALSANDEMKTALHKFMMAKSVTKYALLPEKTAQFFLDKYLVKENAQ